MFDKANMRSISLLEDPFIMTGLLWSKETHGYDRIPNHLMPKDATDLFKEIATECSGGIARIRTNSKKVYFEGKVRQVKKTLYHMSRVGRSGFDFHIRREGEEIQFLQTSVPIEYGETNISCEVAVLKSGLYDERPVVNENPGIYELRIVLPTYNAVDQACIWVEEESEVLPPLPQTHERPILFYGSSITQGACASRPSNCYTNRLALALDCPIINFGFSGSAKGEEEIARLIAQQDMAVFVMDYDHNAPDVKYLRETHRPFFEIVRGKHPSVPVVFPVF